MNYELESQRLQAAQVMQNEAERDPRRGRKWKAAAPRKPDGFSETSAKQFNRMDTRLKLHQSESLKAALAKLK